MEHLTKRYGGRAVVDDASFICLPGQVVGFLGPNGAGKSTTLRVLTGLTAADSGVARIDGYQYRDIPNPARQVGTLLDAAGFHNGRAGRATLQLRASAMGLPDRRVDEMLELVGLTIAEAHQRIGTYSLGMRQRLGVASALLGEPSVLILDEPVNGLDPAGIHWMRGVLRGFADAGGTVLLSSHLLHEIELIADHIVVIGQGRVMAQGPTESLTGPAGTLVASADDAALAAALTAAGMPVHAEPGGGLSVAAEPAEVGAVAANAQIALTQLGRAGAGRLEQIYLQLTASAQRGEPTPGVTVAPGQYPGQPPYPGAAGYPPPGYPAAPGYPPAPGYPAAPGDSPPPGPYYPGGLR